MQPFILSARPSGKGGDYLPLQQCALQAECGNPSGDGSAAAPILQEIRITAGAPFEGVIRISLPLSMARPRFFLPGFMYGTNRGESPLVVDSKCPRLRKEGEFPASPWWMVRSDRLSHPCAFAWEEGRLTGFAASPYYIRTGSGKTPWEPGTEGPFEQYAGFGCSIGTSEIFYTLGYENAPWFFLDAHQFFQRTPGDQAGFSLTPGETVIIRLYRFDYPAADERALHGALEWVYRRFHQSPARKCTLRQTVSAIAGAIARDAWLPEKHMYSGFVFDRGDHFEYNPLPSISWTNGLSAAVPMLLSAHRLQDENMRAQALDCIGRIVAHSLNQRSGLPYMTEQDGQWSNHGWWFDRLRTPGHAAYLVGQTIYLILKAWALEKEKYGVVHNAWLDFCARVLARTEQTRNSDGEYPYVLSEKTGAGLEYDSFSGAWCMAAAAYYAFLTGDRAYVPGLLRSEQWYHHAYIRHQECYGGPLDIDKNIDSEGILAYIRAVRYLHAITGEEMLLDHMQDALHYEYTFKFCYNSPIQTPPLSTARWCSCGGSITSVTNPHIHPMSSSVIDEMHYYLACREDHYIRSRMEDTILWSCQCHNTYDREFGYGKTGWMSERFCHSQGLVKERYPDGTLASTWFALMPWACGSILEGLTGMAWDADESD